MSTITNDQYTNGRSGLERRLMNAEAELTGARALLAEAQQEEALMQLKDGGCVFAGIAVDVPDIVNGNLFDAQQAVTNAETAVANVNAAITELDQKWAAASAPAA